MAVSGHPLLHPLRAITSGTHPVLAKYLRDRGPHLAAMVAYYALLSLVPFLFLMLSLLGLLGPVSSGSYVIRELGHILPGQSATDLIQQVHTIQHNAGTLGAIGVIGLAWGTLGFYSALESALNIVFGVSNRAFLHQKGVTHNNLTPPNILIQSESKATLLADLMLDKALEGSELADLIREKKLLADLP